MYQNFLGRLQAHQERGMKEITTSILNCTVGNKKDFFKMAAWNAGVVGKDLPESETILLENTEDDCWDQIQVDFTLTGSNSYEVSITPSGLRDPTFQKCASVYTIATTRTIAYPISIQKPHKITVVDANDAKMLALKTFGLHFYRQCDSVQHLMPDLYMTLLLFIGGLGTNPNIPFLGSKPAPWQNVLNP
jgi:hypothetical protein